MFNRVKFQLLRSDALAWGSRIVSLIALLLLIGCSAAELPEPETAEKTAEKSPAAAPAGNAMPGMAKMAKMDVDPAGIEFKDEVVSNVEPPRGLEGLVFIDTAGKRVQLKDYLGKKHVVLVFTEGFAGMLCPFCTTQTSRLVANYPKFAELDTEVLVVYPGTRDHLDEFIEAAKTTDKGQVEKVPFPLVLDEEFVAVDFFDIRSNFAHPSTYIIDKSGNVRLAYVGADMTADRPSVKAILKHISAAN